MKRVRLPSVPRSMHTALGEVRVRQVKKVDTEDSLGEYDSVKRLITLKKGLDHVQKHRTLWHEWVHVVLHDAGVDSLLKDKQEEAVCNAIATALVNGLLAKVSPHTEGSE